MAQEQLCRLMVGTTRSSLSVTVNRCQCVRFPVSRSLYLGLSILVVHHSGEDPALHRGYHEPERAAEANAIRGGPTRSNRPSYPSSSICDVSVTPFSSLGKPHSDPDVYLKILYASLISFGPVHLEGTVVANSVGFELHDS